LDQGTVLGSVGSGGFEFTDGRQRINDSSLEPSLSPASSPCALRAASSLQSSLPLWTRPLWTKPLSASALSASTLSAGGVHPLLHSHQCHRQFALVQRPVSVLVKLLNQHGGKLRWPLSVAALSVAALSVAGLSGAASATTLTAAPPSASAPAVSRRRGAATDRG
jgi:hypothetical protein